MRIGVVSLKVNNNYGGLMQAWSLQQILFRMGHNPTLLDSPGPRSLTLWGKVCKYPERAFKKYFLNSPKPIRHEKITLAQYCRQFAIIKPFIDRNLQIRTINRLDELSETDFDMFIFGSDQVWRPEYFRNHFGKMGNAFGAFAHDWKNVKLASYAASFGIDSLREFTPNEIDVIRRMLPRFSGVSVRESSGVGLCRELGVEATHVIDPTMLLDRNDYLQLIEDAGIPKRWGIMTYVLDAKPEIKLMIEKISSVTGLPVFSTISDDPQHPYLPEQWIAGFRDTELVVTDSFHACVFSILFNRPFLVVDNPWRGSARIDSLLEMFELSDHKISPDAILPANPLKAFGYDRRQVADRLQYFRHSSLNYLSSILA